MTNIRLRRAVSPFEQLLLQILLSGPRSGLDLVRLCGKGQPDPRVVRTTYLALHRLELRGLLACEWRPISGRQLRLKRYRLTPAGCHSITGSNGGVQGPQLTVMIVIALIWAVDSLGASHDSSRPRFTIAVDDDASVPPSDIARARGDVTRIFGAIGVDVEWLLLQPTSDSGIGALQRPPRSCLIRAWVTLRPPKMTSPSNALILGIAPHSRHEGGAIVLFYENIQAFAQVLRKSAWSVLAATIAHEIGHVFLPAPAHTNAGIMQPSWHEGSSGRIDLEQSLFSAQQGHLIRQQLTQCASLPH